MFGQEFGTICLGQLLFLSRCSLGRRRALPEAEPRPNRLGNRFLEITRVWDRSFLATTKGKHIIKRMALEPFSFGQEFGQYVWTRVLDNMSGAIVFF